MPVGLSSAVWKVLAFYARPHAEKRRKYYIAYLMRGDWRVRVGGEGGEAWRREADERLIITRVETVWCALLCALLLAAS